MTRLRSVLPTYQCNGLEYFIGERITMRTTIVLSALLLSCCGENTVRVSGYGKRSPNEQDTQLSRPYFKRRPTPTPAPTMRPTPTPTPTPTAYPQQQQQQQQHNVQYRCKCGKVVKVCGKDEVLSGYCYIIYGE
jgi:hypothetical protein